MARETARRVGMQVTVVRPGPIYGPGDRRLFKLIGGVARRRFRILGDGRPRFQMVYVDDLVDGFLLAGEHPDAAGRTYISRDDEAPTLRELVNEIAEVANVPPPKLGSRCGRSGCWEPRARRSASRSASSPRSSGGG